MNCSLMLDKIQHLICYSIVGGQLHAVSGPEFSLNPWSKKPTGYIIDMDSGELEGTWNVPGGLSNPHDVAVSQDGNIVYVVELNPFKVWKLTNGGSRSSSETLSSNTDQQPDTFLLALKARIESLLG